MKTIINNLITKGHYSVNLPILAIYLTSYFLFDLSFAVLGFTTLIAWGFWSIAIPKWKLNSLKNLNSTSEYFEWNSKAIVNGLIWAENSLINKTEIWNKNDKAEYEELKNSLLNVNTNSGK
jgi:ABC-type transport system involved in Fe-S cluster assembly fused permease/ATPase subunit